MGRKIIVVLIFFSLFMTGFLKKNLLANHARIEGERKTHAHFLVSESAYNSPLAVGDCTPKCSLQFGSQCLVPRARKAAAPSTRPRN